jgi:WD40 repeat protein
MYSPDGKLLAACDSSQVKLYDAAEGQLVHALVGDEQQMLAVAFDRSGKSVAGGALDGTVRIWDAASGRLLHTMTGHKDMIDALAFSPDGKWLAVCLDDGSVELWGVVKPG